VGVREKSEICRLRYRVFELERKRDALQRQERDLVAGAAEALSPRQLLEELERRRALGIPVPSDAPAPVVEEAVHAEEEDRP
jgi:hypothetical protein